MGDLANMTDCDGRVHGTRMLLWLRSRAAVEREDEKGCGELYCVRLQHWHRGRADLLTEMADDLERELTPPDYPEDDGGEVVMTDGGDLRTCPDCGARHNSGSHVEGCCPACVGRRILAITDDTAGPGDRDTGPCDGCGRMAGRVLVQDNGRAWLACPACAARADDDTVDLDDPALTVDEDERNQP